MSRHHKDFQRIRHFLDEYERGWMTPTAALAGVRNVVG